MKKSKHKYAGKGSNVPDVVSADAVIVILLFMVLSIFLASIAFLVKRKNKTTISAFIILIILDLHKIIQIMFLLHKAENGILPSG